MNLYCEIINSSPICATYAFGSDSENLSGKIIFKRDGSYEVLCFPVEDYVTDADISMLVSKYKKLFETGNFPKKISRES